MGQQGRPAIPEHQERTAEVEAAAIEFRDDAISQLPEITGSGEMEGHEIPKPHV